MSKLITSIIGLMTLIGIIFSVYFWMDDRYANAETVKKIEQRLDYKIKSDQAQSIRERIWRIEDKFGSTPSNPIVKEELRKLQFDLNEINGQVKEMEKK